MENLKTKRKGRPVVNGSKRQQRIAERQLKIESGEGIRKGRPTNETSKRQQRMAEREAKLAAGVPIQRGRPKVKVPSNI
jgi:hypothetical protein